MNRWIIFIMGGAIVALAFAVVSLSTVAIMAQTMALVSQCLLTLGLLSMGTIIVGSIALRNRVLQIYLARRLLGTETDRILTEHRPGRIEALPETFPRNQYVLPSAENMSARVRSVQTQSLTLPALPVMPQGWGFDEED